VQAVLPELTRQVCTYGIDSDQADVRAVNIRQQGMRMHFEVRQADYEPLAVTLNLPGSHNVLNALAAIAVARELDIDTASIQRALESFAGIGRRFQVNGELALPEGSVLFVDDYGHHPREIAATLAAVRSGWPERRLVTVFQPHRYTRTHDLFDDFAQVLVDADVLLICEVYDAGEEPVTGADGRALCRAVRSRGRVDPVFVEEVEGLPEVLVSLLEPGDVVLTLGAGSIGAVAASLPARLADMQSGGEA
jgi:UDP-N-acetylmuramate--alanine ligase